MHSLLKQLFGLAGIGLLSASVLGQGTDAVVSANHIEGGLKIFGSMSLDYTTAHYFFGTPLENQGKIIQPSLTLGATLPDNVFGLSWIAADVYAGTFNSLHFDNPSNDLALDQNQAWWFEGDYYVGTALRFPLGFTLDIAYWNVNGLANDLKIVEEFDIILAYDDGPAWSHAGFASVALTPYVGLVVEIDGGNDGLGDQGSPGKLFLVGLEPHMVVYDGAGYSLTPSAPIEVGIDISSYHETVAGIDDAFSYFQLGAVLSASLAFITEMYGAWTASFGGYLIVLGDATQEIGRNDFNVIGDGNMKVWLKAGVSLSF